MTASSVKEIDLKVVAVTNYQELKGKVVYAGIFTNRQIESLRRIGVCVTVIDIGTSHSPFKLFRQFLTFRSEIRRQRPDIVHGQIGTIVGFFSVLSGQPTVVSFCGSDLQSGASISRLRILVGFALSNFAALRARQTICQSEQLRKALWWRHDQSVVIPTGIDLNLFSPGSQKSARWQLGWDIGHPVVIHYTSQDPVSKGLNVVEATMTLVKTKLPSAELRLISNIEPDRMHLIYRAADVVLVASKNEGSPNVVKEALACNLPVVTCAVGDVEERLKGVLPSAVVPRDPTAMAEAVVDILTNRLRSNGREKVSNLSMESVAKRVLSVYQSVLRS